MKKDKTERFIEAWGSKRSKGKNKFIIVNSSIYIIGIIIVSIAISLYTGNDLNYNIIIGLSLGGVIGNILGWYANEQKYNEIING